MNCVCAGTFDGHEWVSESTAAQHVEEVMGMELDCKIGIPCVVQMVHVKVFSTYTIESSIGKREIKIKKYYEALNMAIMYAISRPFGGKHTPRSSMLASVAKVLHQNKQKVVSEQGDGRMGDEMES